MDTAGGAAPGVVPSIPPRLSLRAKLSLIGEILAAYVRARRALSRTDLRNTLTTVRGTPPPPAETLDAATYGEGLRLGSVVARVCRPLPIDSRCLIQSLVLTRLLARRGVGSTLVIGVRGGESFGAHAWVELAGRPLLPPGESEFERLVEL